MSGSTFGRLFRVTTWGESHGAAIGAVIDGCPAGLPLSEADIQTFLDRRKPGQSKYTTKRNEADHVEILSGIFEGRTTGTPFLSSSAIRTSAPGIMGIWRTPSVLGMRTILLRKNMAYATTAEAAGHRAERPSGVSLPVQLLPYY